MSDDEEGYDFEYESDDDFELSLNDALISGNVADYLKKHYGTNYNHQIDNDTYNLALESNNFDVLKQVIKLGAKPQPNSLDLSIKTGNAKVIQLTERECKNCKISADGTNDLIKTNDSNLYRLFIDKLTKKNTLSLNLAIANATNTTTMIEKMVELGCKPNEFTFDTAIETKNVDLLKYVLNYFKSDLIPTRNSLIEAIKTGKSEIVKLVQKHIGRVLNETETNLFLTYFTEEDLFKYGIKYNMTLIPDIPKWNSYCVHNLGLKELREILIDAGIQQVENKSVKTLSKEEICRFLNGEYDIHKITLDNQLYRCINDAGFLSGQVIAASDDYLIDDENVNEMAYCLPKTDLQQMMSSESDYFSHPYKGTEMSPELLARIETYVHNDAVTPKSMHQPNVSSDDLHINEIKSSFSLLRQYSKLIDVSVVNKYIQLSADQYINLFRELISNLQLPARAFDAYYDGTLENKSLFLKKIMESEDKLPVLCVLIRAFMNDI